MTTTTGRVALALDALLTDPDPATAQAIARLRAATTPTWLDDQIGAATAHAIGGLEALSAAGAIGGRTNVTPSALPAWVRLGLLDVLTRWSAGRIETCLHSPHPDRPEPIAAVAWKPDLVTCARCPHLFRLPRGSDADRRCDGCGRVTDGLDADDPVWPSLVQVGPLSYTFACCGDCRDWEAA